jgi:hypothetical protein
MRKFFKSIGGNQSAPNAFALLDESRAPNVK